MSDIELNRLIINLTKLDSLEKISNTSTGAHLGLTISHLISMALSKCKFGGLKINS